MGCLRWDNCFTASYFCNWSRKSWLKAMAATWSDQFSAIRACKDYVELVSSCIYKQQGETDAHRKRTSGTFLLVLPIVGIVGIENLSTCIILLAISFIMIFVATPLYKPFLGLIGIGVAGAVLLILTQGYRMERITVWLDPASSDKGEQTMQGLYAIGSGGLFGKGLGQSMQKLGFLPEANNDMIFSVICEELGLFGALCVLALFFALLWRFMVIAINAPDLYGSMLVIGVIAHIGIQVFINIAVATNTMPNTGIPLPFISYGGSSLVFLLLEMGLVLSVSRYIKIKK